MPGSSAPGRSTEERARHTSSAAPARGSHARLDTVVLDLDGTLVDSVYVHTAAWRAAFREVGVDVPAYRIHRAIGIGGDRLVEAVAGAGIERAVGDKVREMHGRHLDERFHEITPLAGAGELLERLDAVGLTVVLASSSPPDLTDRLLGLVEGSWRLRVRVSGAEAQAGKPAADLIELALHRVSAGRAVVVGDSVWDVEAAAAAGIPCVGLSCGGTSPAELMAAGAMAVLETPLELAHQLEDVLAAVGSIGR